MAPSEQPPADPSLEIRLFGPFAVRVEGRPLPRLRTRKGQWLLALLVLRSGREVDREWLAATLWPESSEQQAFANLRLSLTDLRHALGRQAGRLTSPSPRTLCLDPAGAEIDMLAFDAALARGGDVASLERAVALYRGPLLEGCLEEWVLQEREARGQAYLQALESLASQAMGRGDAATAVRHLRAAVAADPLRESALRALMQALARGGSYAAAVMAYRHYRDFLRREMAAEPDPETRAVFRQIRTDARRRAQTTAAPAVPPEERGASPPLPETAAAAQAPLPAREPARPIPSGNLPHQRTSFIGRQPQIEAVRAALLPPWGDADLPVGPGQARLVTLTGAGGSGKTRLALRVAEGLREAYTGGVWLVELAPLLDPALVPQGIAAALGVHEQPERALAETLEEYLGPRSLLLVLDNCEHVLEASARLADRLLQSCPGLRILATSRERLRLSGEFEYRVPALGSPADSETLSVEEALAHEAVQLFAERAVFSRPDFAVTKENLPAVALVCRRLDGSPLAIELAAARTRVLTVEQLARRLDDRFRLLTDGSRAALPRQQTLRAAIDWSYDLLDEPERALLRRLSVFAGGCSLEAAESVCAGEGIEEWEVLERLSSLVEKSLVVAEDRGGADGMRYHLLETVRQYGQERLAETGEATRVRKRHVERALWLAEEADGKIWDEDGPVWMGRLDSEHDNLRAALEYSRDIGDECESGMRLAGALAQFWYMRGHWSEGRDWVETMLRQGHERASFGRAKALLGAGILAWDQDDYRNARPYLEQSRALWLQIGDSPGYAETVLVLGCVLGTLGEYAEGKRLLDEALEYSRRTGSESGTVFCLAYLARNAFEQEDYATARSLSRECLALSQEIEHRWGSAFALMILGSVAGKERDFDRAIGLCQESLALSQELGNRRGQARCRLVLGLIACRRERFEEATRHFRECRSDFQDLGDKEGICYTLEGMALMSALSGFPERAIRLQATAQGLRAAIGIPLPPSSRTMMESWLAGAQAQLDVRSFSEVWAEGLRTDGGRAMRTVFEDVS